MRQIKDRQKYLLKIARKRLVKRFPLQDAPKEEHYLRRKESSRVSEKLQEGDHVKLFLSDETFLKFAGQPPVHKDEANVKSKPVSLSVVYEDEDILIINKPQGMLSQKAKPSGVSADEYILEYLLAHRRTDREDLRTFRPSICNRLDRNTSGLLIAGKKSARAAGDGRMLKRPEHEEILPLYRKGNRCGEKEDHRRSCAGRMKAAIRFRFIRKKFRAAGISKPNIRRLKRFRTLRSLKSI